MANKHLETNHWAVCEADGSVRYSQDDNRAEIYGTREDARRCISDNYPGDNLHVERVEVI